MAGHVGLEDQSQGNLANPKVPAHIPPKNTK